MKPINPSKYDNITLCIGGVQITCSYLYSHNKTYGYHAEILYPSLNLHAHVYDSFDEHFDLFKFFNTICYEYIYMPDSIINILKKSKHVNR